MISISIQFGSNLIMVLKVMDQNIDEKIKMALDQFMDYGLVLLCVFFFNF